MCRIILKFWEAIISQKTTLIDLFWWFCRILWIFAKFLRTSFFTEHLRWLRLVIKVIWLQKLLKSMHKAFSRIFIGFLESWLFRSSFFFKRKVNVKYKIHESCFYWFAIFNLFEIYPQQVCLHQKSIRFDKKSF